MVGLVGGGAGGGVEPEEDRGVDGGDDDGGTNMGWLPAFPNEALASMANFLFGYHIGVMNGPIVLLAHELGFEGNSLLEGVVVSIFIASAFIGNLFFGSLVDNLGCRKTFQIVTVPLLIGAFIRWRVILYIATIPGFILISGMQFCCRESSLAV